MSSICPTCSAVAVATGSPCGMAHGTDQQGNAPLVPAASIVSPPTTTTQYPPSTRPVRPGRKSFAEALYRALLRLAPTRKVQIQAVFRFFKVRTELSHQQVQQVLISALGLELVREAWTEARKEINEHVQAEVAYMLRPMGSSSGTAPSSPSSSSSPTPPSVSSPSVSPTSSAHATAMALLQWQQQRQQNQQQRQEQPQPEAATTLTRPRPLGGEEEEEARRVRARTLMPRPRQPRAMPPRQSTMFWRAGEAMPSAIASSTTGASAAAQQDVGISIVLASLSCPPPSPSLQRADRSHSQDSITSTTTTAAHAAAAVAVSSSSAASRSIFCASSIAVSVDDGESELEDEDLLLQDAPNAFVCPISLQLMTRAVVAGDGFSYQREALDKWILRNRRERKPLRSPMTNAAMAPFYTPSFTLRSMVGDFVDLARAKRRREGGVAHVMED